jgi:hypothetical protein
MTKNWPAHELAGLASRQVSERNIILPIWHGVSAQMVKDFSPTLADLVAIRTADNDPNGIAFQILKTVRPDIYETASRTEIENSINVEATNLLQDEIKERLKDSINRKLPTNGRGEISATVMREVFFEVIDYVSAVSNFHRSNAANQFQNRQQRSPVENC